MRSLKSLLASPRVSPPPIAVPVGPGVKVLVFCQGFGVCAVGGALKSMSMVPSCSVQEVGSSSIGYKRY